jgi:hypothetical protein
VVARIANPQTDCVGLQIRRFIAKRTIIEKRLHFEGVFLWVLGSGLVSLIAHSTSTL